MSKCMGRNVGICDKHRGEIARLVLRDSDVVWKDIYARDVLG